MIEYVIAYTTRANTVIKTNGKSLKIKIEKVVAEVLKFYHGLIAELPCDIKLVASGKFKNVPRFKIDNIIIPFKLEKVNETKTKIIILDIIF